MRKKFKAYLSKGEYYFLMSLLYEFIDKNQDLSKNRELIKFLKDLQYKDIAIVKEFLIKIYSKSKRDIVDVSKLIGVFNLKKIMRESRYQFLSAI